MTLTIFTIGLIKHLQEKLVILQSIGIIAIKSKETMVVTYTCRYSSGHFTLKPAAI